MAISLLITLLKHCAFKNIAPILNPFTLNAFKSMTCNIPVQSPEITEIPKETWK